MNPYDVLGVSSDATASQIKAAYRKAVKRYHPDATKVADSTMVALVNEAYELLSDPQRKQAYDISRYGVVTFVKKEDPRAEYKKEFLRKKREQENAKLAKEMALFRKIYKCNFYLAILSLVLIIDSMLPTIEYHDMPASEWIANMGGKHMHYFTYRIETENFKLSVPYHISYEYDLAHPQPLRIEASPVFRIPTLAQIKQPDGVVEFVPLYTLYSYAFPFHYALFIFAGLTLLFREHSPMTFSLSFGPPVVAMMMLFFLIVA